MKSVAKKETTNKRRLITRDDILDIYQKWRQRGLPFLLSKLNINANSRTKSAFDNSAEGRANWWMVPKVRRRWNEMITGDPTLIYESYVYQHYLNNRNDLKMLSVGSGVCSHELNFAKQGIFKEVICVDMAENLLQKASKTAHKEDLSAMQFVSESIYNLEFEKNRFDVILFHASLHHFPDIDHFLKEIIGPWLKPNGYIIINEYVGANRMQYPRHQITAINKGLQLIPDHLKIRQYSNLIKKQFRGPGWIRMIVADPSECVDSESILPALRTKFKVLEEKPYGGNLLMSILKDIAHHFTDEEDQIAQDTLRQLFDFEDLYLKKYPSDFLFGIYQKTED
ncbi:MAG TPA: class I SAM-dependent methyltransferase [Saprospiraceae bacterium]|nr:class I SAM-dependent methyltransferase [Saprospiraceae bacterium]